MKTLLQSFFLFLALGSLAAAQEHLIAAERAVQGKQFAQPTNGQQLKQGDYLQNLDIGNDAIQRDNIQNWDKLRRGKGGKGVEVQKAY